MLTFAQSHNIPVPEHVVMSRDVPNPPSFVEEDDSIIVDGKRLCKPFVEKPVSGEDHNVYVYYPRSAGGGSKRLFRKVGDRSSEFYREVSQVRKEGSYIYEVFLPTEGTDVKVWRCPICPSDACRCTQWVLITHTRRRERAPSLTARCSATKRERKSAILSCSQPRKRTLHVSSASPSSKRCCLSESLALDLGRCAASTYCGRGASRTCAMSTGGHSSRAQRSTGTTVPTCLPGEWRWD